MFCSCRLDAGMPRIPLVLNKTSRTNASVVHPYRPNENPGSFATTLSLIEIRTLVRTEEGQPPHVRDRPNANRTGSVPFGVQTIPHVPMHPQQGKGKGKNAIIVSKEPGDTPV